MPRSYQKPIELPPSTGMIVPVRKLDSCVERHSQALATSSGSPSLPIGVLESTRFFRSGSLLRAAADMLVSMKPGAMQLTRIPDGESSTAMARVIPSTADLDAV